jgi:hypothetical protein
VNCYVEPVGDQITLKSVLGMSSFATVPGVFARALAEVGGVLYVAQGGGLYSVTSDGTVTSLGSITDSAETTISSNNGNVTVAAGGNYYVWDGSTLSTPTAGAFSDFGSVEYFGSLTVLTERNGQRVQWSDVLDPTTLDGLNFATANAYDDDLLRVLAIGGSLWMFGERSIEQWYQNGADLAPVAGAAIEFGLKAYGLLSRTPNGAFFVSSDNKVRLMQGGMQVISNRAVETALAQNTATHCFFYQDEGHDICVVRFSDRPAWCYDISTARWHERAEGDTFEAWSAVGSNKAFGKWNVLTEVGTLYQLERTNNDATGALLRQVTSVTLVNEGQRFRVKRFEVEGRVGFSDLGRDASVSLQMSKDHGMTWTDAKTRSMGDLGEYQQRMVWRSLGQYRNATFRLTISDAAELPISNTAYLEVA